MNELTVELFAPGKWNGMVFDKDDLKDMAENFKTLKSVLFAPVKLGHNDEQQITDGMPALGEIVDTWYTDAGKDGKPKLMGKLAGLPDVVFTAINKRRYNKLSIELDIGVSHQGRFMKYVLTAVALLGADLPAVNTLADLNAYMSRKSLFADHKQKMVFTKAFTSNMFQEETDMEYEKLYNELNVKFSKLEAELATTKAEVITLTATKESFERDTKKREEDAKKQAIGTARATIAAKFEKAVTDEIITPAKRDQFTKLLNIDDDEAVLKIKAEDVDALLTDAEGKMFTKSTTRTKSRTERTVVDAGSELTTKAYEIMNVNNGMDFTVAFERAMRANPELAAEHLENKSNVA
jgi:hypothetical protein